MGRHCKNMIGQRIGNWIVLELSDQRTTEGRAVWKCQCQCPAKTIKYFRGDVIHRSGIKSCESCRFLEIGEIWKTKWKIIKKLPKYEYLGECIICGHTKVIRYTSSDWCRHCDKYGSDHKSYTSKKADALLRGIKFTLSESEFKNIKAQRCVYCGSDSNIQIDRRIPERGYILENVQPLCKVCNTMKCTWTERDFQNHIRKMYSTLCFRRKNYGS